MRGIKRKIAQKAGVSEQYVGLILNGKRKNVSPKYAEKLGYASNELGLPFSKEDWVFRADEINDFLNNHSYEISRL